MELLIQELSLLPSVLAEIFTSPTILMTLFLGVIAGYVIGVIPGLGPTMGMALVLGLIYRMPQIQGLSLLIGILVASMSSGGITACLANIPGTAAAAATVLDGYPMTKLGRGREACGYAYMSSVIGSILAMIIVFFIQPLIATIALKFGNWEVFLFCIFGILLCGSLVGNDPLRGWISAMLGVLIAMCGAEPVQSISRFTFGSSKMLAGVDSVVVILGLFGLSEVFYALMKKQKSSVESQSGFPIINVTIFIKNIPNIIRSTLAGIWVGFIPGIGETVACWFSYDIAKRASKQKDKFGKGCEEGIIAAEVANNASSVGALIPSLALGIPGSGSTAVFIAALFLIGFRPGPTLMTDAPGILSKISVLFILSALVLAVAAYFLSRFAIRLLTIKDAFLMPLIVIFCAIGAYATTFTKFSLIVLLVFGILGTIMKMYNYPIAPMLLGILVGNTMDTSLRRAIMQYQNNPFEMVTRPIGLVIIVFLVAVFVLSIRTTKATNAVAKEAIDESEFVD